MKYGPHKSSLFDLDANIAALLVYLLPWLISVVSDKLSSIVWIIPLLALLMEKDSDFVSFHAANSLSFYVIQAMIHIISTVLGLTAVVSAWISSIAIIGVISAGITGIFMVLLGIIFVIIEIYLLIGKIISVVKAYDYRDINIPVIHAIATFILSLKR